MKTSQTTVAIWGKSVAVRIPADVVRTTGWQVGQTVQFEQGADGTVIMRPVRTRLDLNDLLEQVTEENIPDEKDIDWGNPIGTEVW